MVFHIIFIKSGTVHFISLVHCSINCLVIHYKLSFFKYFDLYFALFYLKY